MGIHLNKGESVIHKTHPHILAMIDLYLIWLYIGIVGGVYLAWRGEIFDWINGWAKGESLTKVVYFILWSLALFIPSIFLTIFRINWRWLLLSTLLCLVGILLHSYGKEVIGVLYNWEFSKHTLLVIQKHTGFTLESSHIENYLLIFVSFIGILLSNSYRRSHAYYITNQRILLRFGFITKRERDILYGKIDDLIVYQGILGRLLGYGTIIPISASGIGTGSDQALVFGSVGTEVLKGPKISVAIGGGKSITVPRAPSFYSLYGIPNPDELKEIIIQQMGQREYGYTHRMKNSEKK